MIAPPTAITKQAVLHESSLAAVSLLMSYNTRFNISTNYNRNCKYFINNGELVERHKSVPPIQPVAVRYDFLVSVSCYLAPMKQC